MQVTPTDAGVLVVETSDDPHVARLIQEHAKVVSLFLENGYAEVHTDHAVPGQEGQTRTAMRKGQGGHGRGGGCCGGCMR